MKNIRPVFDSRSEEGKKCRRLLKYFKTLCARDANFENDAELPDITDVSEPEMDCAAPPTRSYRSLFGVQHSNQADSVILAGSDRRENDITNDDLENLNEIASSTVIRKRPTRPVRPVLSTVFEVPVAASIADCSINLSTTDLAMVSDITSPQLSVSDEPVLTPPPPYIPSPRRRPAAPSSASPPSESPPPRRGRGRPRLDRSQVPPPAQQGKRRVGRPRKNIGL